MNVSSAGPLHAQDELAEIARDIEENLRSGEYEPTEAELAGNYLARLAGSGRKPLSPLVDQQVETALTKLRNA